MWVRVDDGMPEHEKVLEAGRHLGSAGAGRVVAIWLVGMCYCNRNLTDGFLRESIVRTWTLYDRRPVDVALAMALTMPDERPGLLVRVDGGFQFHDYDHYQPSAAEQKAKRKRDRDRKRRKAAEKLQLELAEFGADSTAESITDSARNPERSRARDPGPARPDRSAPAEQDPRGSRRVQLVETNLDVLRAVVWAEVRAGLEAGERTWTDLLERVKVQAARARIDYATPASQEQLHRQFEIAIARLAPELTQADASRASA